MGVVIAADESEDPDIDINQLHEFKHVQNHRDELLLNLQNKLKRQRRPSSQFNPLSSKNYKENSFSEIKVEAFRVGEKLRHFSTELGESNNCLIQPEDDHKYQSQRDASDSQAIKILYNFKQVQDLKFFQEILCSFNYSTVIESQSHMSFTKLIGEVKQVLNQFDIKKIDLNQEEINLKVLCPIHTIFCQVNLHETRDWEVSNRIHQLYWKKQVAINQHIEKNFPLTNERSKKRKGGPELVVRSPE